MVGSVVASQNAIGKKSSLKLLKMKLKKKKNLLRLGSIQIRKEIKSRKPAVRGSA